MRMVAVWTSWTIKCDWRLGIGEGIIYRFRYLCTYKTVGSNLCSSFSAAIRNRYSNILFELHLHPQQQSAILIPRLGFPAIWINPVMYEHGISSERIKKWRTMPGFACMGAILVPPPFCVSFWPRRRDWRWQTHDLPAAKNNEQV